MQKAWFLPQIACIKHEVGISAKGRPAGTRSIYFHTVILRDSLRENGYVSFSPHKYYIILEHHRVALKCKTQRQIKKHKRKSETMNANQKTQQHLHLRFWFAFVFFDLRSCFLICVHVFWLAFVFFDLRLCFLICILFFFNWVHVFWFVVMVSDLRSGFLICVCVFWFAFTVSNVPLCFGLQGHRRIILSPCPYPRMVCLGPKSP